MVKYYLKSGSIKGVDYNNFMERIHKNKGKYKYLVDNARIDYSKLIKDDIKKRTIFNVPNKPEYNTIEY